jgi:preprotein translocase subunit SecD
MRLLWRLTILVLLITVRLSRAALGQEQPINGLQIILGVDAAKDSFKQEDVLATATVISGRLKVLDTKNYRVQVVGADRIQIQLPGAADTDAILKTITKPGLLELVDFNGLRDKVSEFNGGQIVTTEQVRRAAQAKADLPPGQNNPLTGKPFETILTGAALQTAAAQLDANMGRWMIAFELKPEGAKIFGDFTEKHIGEPVAIVLDGVVLSAPVVQSRLDKDGVIQGNFTEAETKVLAAQLRYGALPLALKVESMDTLQTIVIGE